MNARDTLQALLDGEIIIDSNGYLWRLDEHDELVQRKPEKERWEHSHIIFNDDCEIYNEYPLDFEHALIAMLDGRTVMRESSDEHAYRFRNGMFESSTKGDCFTEWESCTMFASTQKAKWKVVE